MAAMALGHVSCSSQAADLHLPSVCAFQSLRPSAADFRSVLRPACRSRRLSVANAMAEVKESVNVDKWNEQIYADRLQHLESQAIASLKRTVESFANPTFPCALILGDVVLLDLLDKIGALQNETVKVAFIDTFHLFPETYEFLSLVQQRYNFKMHTFHADGFNNRDEYVAKHGADLYIRDIEEYDSICKVEPFKRALSTLKTDAMINGRRRDHGAERAHLEVVEDKGPMVNIQPLAYWEFRDCWNYLTTNKVPYHPLHDEGYPSVGDIQSTLPVPREKWFEYGAERSGRFQGMTNKDGSVKTECGIHSQK